jgi:hypothetical protein
MFIDYRPLVPNPRNTGKQIRHGVKQSARHWKCISYSNLQQELILSALSRP